MSTTTERRKRSVEAFKAFAASCAIHQGEIGETQAKRIAALLVLLARTAHNLKTGPGVLIQAPRLSLRDIGLLEAICVPQGVHVAYVAGRRSLRCEYVRRRKTYVPWGDGLRFTIGARVRRRRVPPPRRQAARSVS